MSGALLLPSGRHTDVEPNARPRTTSDFNQCAIIVGLPGFGKTTLLKSLVRRHLAERPAGIVLAHDPMGQLTKDGCRYYESAAAWRKSAADAARTKSAMPRGAAVSGESEDVVRLAVELGRKVNRADRVAVPILLACDEASLRAESGSTWTGKLDNELLSTRRHLGIAPVFNLQEAKQLSRRFFQGATDVYLFRQTEDRAAELDSLLFLERGTLSAAGVTELEKHRYVHVRVGDGVVSEPM